MASSAQAKGKISETELQIAQLDQNARSDAAKELADVRAKIAELTERRSELMSCKPEKLYCMPLALHCAMQHDSFTPLLRCYITAILLVTFNLPTRHLMQSMQAKRAPFERCHERGLP